MAAEVKPIPEGFHTITPHIVVRDAKAAIEFYKKAFGAQELYRSMGPDGKSIIHATIEIGDSRLMLNDEFPEWQLHGPQTIGGTPVTLHLYVEDADKVYQQAIDAGAEATMPVTDAFWGARYGKLKDPFGHAWSIATHTEDVTPEQIKERADAFFAEASQP